MSDESELNALLYGDFTPNQRSIVLHERLSRYYKQTDEVGDKKAQFLYRGFKVWCKKRGYTQDDINKAKRDFRT